MPQKLPRTFIVGSVVTVVVLLIIYLFTSLPSGGVKQNISQASYTGVDKCATCHNRVTPDIVQQFSQSIMAHSGVRCVDCHVVDRTNPM